MKGTLHWVVALMPEAKVVIEAFDLRKVSVEAGLFPIYESEDASIRLVISGIGKVNAAAATSALACRAGAPRGGVGWINYGIAGCSESRYGEACQASKVTDQGSGRSWYPVPTWSRKSDLVRLPVTTVEKPVTDYSQVSGLVEMEASGFQGIALKQSSVELVHVVKVVFDDPDHPIETLNPGLATELCERAWPRVNSWVGALREVVAEDAVRIAEPPEYAEWCERYHLSVTQQHQLRRLLREWHSLSGEEIEWPPTGASGKASLRSLREQLENRRLSRFRA